MACAGGAMDWIAGVPAHTGSALMSGDAVGQFHHYWFNLVSAYVFDITFLQPTAISGALQSNPHVAWTTL